MQNALEDRAIFRLTGADTRSFLQGLISNDVNGVDHGLVYAAILTPQGKYLADFFLLADHDDLLLDVKASIAAALVQRLTMYKLRSDVQIEPVDMSVVALADSTDGAFADPRHPDMGYRHYGGQGGLSLADYTARRIACAVPETGVELVANESFILEMGFERLAGVNFRKGCYVGQEVTARMKHKTELRKGLAQVQLDGPVEVGAELTADGKIAGTIYSNDGRNGLAYLRYDRATGPMQAGDVTVTMV